MKNHLKFTRMEYVSDGAYKESNECVSVPTESLDKAIIRQESEWWRIIFRDNEGKVTDVEVVKESPLELLKQGVPDE